MAKSLSYRAASLMVTVAIGAALIGSVTAGLSVGLVDSVFKLALYYWHEKLWDRFSPSTAVA
jgi:uncharacterized membrane protein